MKPNLDRRSLLKAAAAAGGLSLARTSVGAPAVLKDLKGSGTVAVYDGGGSWGEACKRAFFDPFERETGIKVIPVPGGDVGSIRASIMAGAPRYDVSNLEGSMTLIFERDGLLLPIDFSWFESSDLHGFDLIKPGKHSVPHNIYSLNIAYDRERMGATPPAHWTDVWDAKKLAGPRSLCAGSIGSIGGTFEAALLADGVDPGKLYPIDWNRAFKSLERIKPSILKWWLTGAEAPQLIIDKQIAIGSAWNGRVSAANEQGGKIGFTWNQGILQYGNYVIPKGAKNLLNAQKYIAFASRAVNQAKFVEHILYAPPNTKAYEFVSPARAQMLPTAPEARKVQLVQDYGFWSALNANGVPNNRYAAAEWEKWITGAR